MDSLPSAGDKVRLTIDDIAFGGEGVGRLGDFVVFVPFVAPGETVEVELTEIKKRFGRARLVKIVEAVAGPRRSRPAAILASAADASTSISIMPRNFVSNTSKSAICFNGSGGLIRR